MGQAKLRGTKQQRQETATSKSFINNGIQAAFDTIKADFAAKGWTQGYDAPNNYHINVAAGLIKEMTAAYKQRNPQADQEQIYNGLYKALALFVPIAKTQYENGVLDMMFGTLQGAFRKLQFQVLTVA